MSAPEESVGRSRRDEYSELTRQAVVSAARTLFAENGFEQTTVQAIADRARVSVATVYAKCGGKEGLLGTLMDIWTRGVLVQNIIDACGAVDGGEQTLRVLADGYVSLYAEVGDIIRVVTAAAASAPTAERYLATANDRHLAALRTIITPIHARGDLRAELSVEDAARIVFFHFRYDQWRLAADEFGWGVERARDWITDRIRSAILNPDGR